MTCTSCGHPLDWHALNPRNNAGVCFGEGPKGAGHCECTEFGVAVPEFVPPNVDEPDDPPPHNQHGDAT